MSARSSGQSAGLRRLWDGVVLKVDNAYVTERGEELAPFLGAGLRGSIAGGGSGENEPGKSMMRSAVFSGVAVMVRQVNGSASGWKIKISHTGRGVDGYNPRM